MTDQVFNSKENPVNNTEDNEILKNTIPVQENKGETIPSVVDVVPEIKNKDNDLVRQTEGSVIKMGEEPSKDPNIAENIGSSDQLVYAENDINVNKKPANIPTIEEVRRASEISAAQIEGLFYPEKKVIIKNQT